MLAVLASLILLFTAYTNFFILGRNILNYWVAHQIKVLVTIYDTT